LTLNRACKRAGIPTGLTTNDLRRTYATLMARAGVPILHLRDLMGHSSTKMLEKVYARVSQDQHMHDAIAHLPRLNLDAIDTDE